MAADEHAEAEEHNETTDYVLIITIFGVLFGVFLRFLQTQFIPEFRQRIWSGIGLPAPSLSILLLGVLTSGLRDVIFDRVYLAYGEHHGDPPLVAEAIKAAQFVDPKVRNGAPVPYDCQLIPRSVPRLAGPPMTAS